jgi:hypothetical protein
MPTSPTTYTFLFLGKFVDSRYAAAAKEDEKISSYAQAQAQAQTGGEGGEHTHDPKALLQGTPARQRMATRQGGAPQSRSGPAT